jgi:hypothetical protein
MKPGEYRSDVYYEDGFIKTFLNVIEESEIAPYLEQIGQTDSISMFIIDTTEIDITSKCQDIVNSSLFDASTGLSKSVSFVPVEFEDADNFLPGAVIKVRVEVSEPKVDDVKMIVNESAFRVLELTDDIRETIGIKPTDTGYLIEGNIDLCQFEKLHQRDAFDYIGKEDGKRRYKPLEMKVTMRPLHNMPVEYQLIVADDAAETMYVY